MRQEHGEIGSLPPRFCPRLAEGPRFGSRLGSRNSDGVLLRFLAAAPAGSLSPPRGGSVVLTIERGLVCGPIEFPTKRKASARGTFVQVAPGDRRMRRLPPRGPR